MRSEVCDHRGHQGETREREAREKKQHAERGEMKDFCKSKFGSIDQEIVYNYQKVCGYYEFTNTLETSYFFPVEEIEATPSWFGRS